MRAPRTVWTADMLATANAMMADGALPCEIDRALELRRGSWSAKLTYHRHHSAKGHAHCAENNARVPAEVIVEQQRRRDAYDARDFTASFCGDPPRGYSALDRRRS